MKIGDLVKHKKGKGYTNHGVVVKRGDARVMVYWFYYGTYATYFDEKLEVIDEGR